MNSTTNTTKPVLSSPSETESHSLESQSIDSGESSNRRKYLNNADRSSLEDHHESRIQALRQQLDYLNNTDWVFENVDRNIEQM